MAKQTKPRPPGQPTIDWCVAGTLAWFGGLGRSLTTAELQRMLLGRAADETEIKQALHSLGSKVVQRRGRHYLRDAPVIDSDAERRRWQRYKWWRVGVAVGLLRWIPYVRMVAVANTLADRTADPDSDIDLFIIIKHGRLYFTRGLITLVLHAAGLRRHGRKVANRICLSFFATTNHRDFRSIAITPYDLYLAYWIAGLQPVLDVDGTAHDFRKSNTWVDHWLPNQGATRADPKRAADAPARLTQPARIVEWLLDRTFGAEFERGAAKWQRRRIKAKPANPDPDVAIIATDDMLKFHEKDRRRTYREAWESAMRQAKFDPGLICDLQDDS